MTNAELLLSPEYDAKKKSKFSNNILVMTKQIKTLVKRLLELSRIDNGSMETVMEPLDFSALVETSLYPFDPLYFEADLELASQITPDIIIKGREKHLKQVIDILLENALKYAAPHTPVKVCLQRQHFTCLLSVSNQGESISEEDLKNIFKRFYRADQSCHQTRGYGLSFPVF